MPHDHRFEIRIVREETSRYLQDGLDSYVETVEAASAEEVIESLENYRLIVVPASTLERNY
jgi:hypothetical protein